MRTITNRMTFRSSFRPIPLGIPNDAILADTA